jgi:hypothetical protein
MHHDIIYVRADGTRLGLDNDEGGPCGDVTEEEMELIRDVYLADGMTGACWTRRSGEPLVIAPFAPLSADELNAARKLHKGQGTPREDLVVSLVAKGWATPSYQYPLGILTAKGTAALKSMIG